MYTRAGLSVGTSFAGSVRARRNTDPPPPIPISKPKPQKIRIDEKSSLFEELRSSRTKTGVT